MAKEKSGDVLTRIEQEEADAEALRLAAYKRPDDADTAGNAASSTDENQAASVAQSKADSAAQSSASSDQGGTGGGQETSEQKAERERLAEETRRAAEAEGKDYKAMYSTLQGKYDAEVPRLSAQLKDAMDAVKSWRDYASGLEERQKALEEEVRTLRTVQAQKGSTETIDLDLSKNPDLASVLVDYPGLKSVLAGVEQERQDRLKEIEDLRKKVDAQGPAGEAETAAQKDQRFRLDMLTLVGRDWEVIDHDPEFTKFLQVEVPYTGKTRLQMVQEASKNRDAESVSKFFNDFRAARQAAAGAAASAAAHTDTGAGANAGAGGRKVDDFVSPPRQKGAGHGPTGGGNVPPTYTREDYNRFTNETIRGKFKPENWGGKTESELDKIFDKMIADRTLA